MIRTLAVAVICAVALSVAVAQQQPRVPNPRFEPQTIDDRVAIGYGLAIGDVDGDGRDDILLADARQFVWYRNPDWKKFVMVENLTDRDNVCIAARDIDGDGRVEVAVGAQWNPGETSDETRSGSVHYLIRPDDPTSRWTPIRLPHEPTVHRMRWVKGYDGRYVLIVAPLHGRGNIKGEGAGVRVLAYTMPANPRDEWTTRLVDDSMHMTHNFDPIDLDDGENRGIVLAGRESLLHIEPTPGGWSVENHISVEGAGGAGEVRIGRRGGRFAYVSTVEPMHGHQLAVYLERRNDTGPEFERVVLDDTLAEGHALACADVLGMGVDQIIVGWRRPNAAKKVGVKLFVPAGLDGAQWRQFLIDDNQMACEDVAAADLDADGRPDVIAAGRATKNLIIYWNRTKR